MTDILRHRLYLAASDGDPFIASYVAILDENKLPAYADVAAQDWWGSYQDFHASGAVSSEVFARTDPKKSFFRGTGPPMRAVQTALQELLILRSMCDPSKENQMSDKSPFMSSPFENKGALVKQQQEIDRGSNDRLQRLESPDQRAIGSMSPFAPVALAPAEPVFHGSPLLGNQPSRLPCTQDEPVPRTGGNGFVRVICERCNQVVEMQDQRNGSEDFGLQDLPGKAYDLVELALCGTCRCDGGVMQVHVLVSRSFTRR